MLFDRPGGRRVRRDGDRGWLLWAFAGRMHTALVGMALALVAVPASQGTEDCHARAAGHS